MEETTTEFYNVTEDPDLFYWEDKKLAVVNVSDSIHYCGTGWKDFWDNLLVIYLPLKLVMCGIGIVTNIFNLIVFTRKSMRNPTNYILASLASTDLLCMIRESENVILQLWTKSQLFFGGSNTYALAVAELVNDLLLMLFHCWSTYLTLTIAVWRLICVTFPLKAKSWCTAKNARWSVFLAILWGALLMIPMYMDARIMTANNVTFYYGRASEDVYLTIHAFCIKIFPCLVLTVVILTLIWFLVKAKENRKVLTRSDLNFMDERNLKKQGQFHRTTRMLLVILVVFVITEFPFGGVNAVAILMPYEFAVQCKFPLLAFFNVCEYVSSSVNFFVYLTMSQNYRRTFLASIFTPVWNFVLNRVIKNFQNIQNPFHPPAAGDGGAGGERQNGIP